MQSSWWMMRYHQEYKIVQVPFVYVFPLHTIPCLFDIENFALEINYIIQTIKVFILSESHQLEDNQIKV